MKKKHFALPYIVWMILFTVIPLLLIVIYAVFKTTDSGGRLASWEWGSTKYTLYTAAQVDDETITDLTMNLVELSQYEK